MGVFPQDFAIILASSAYQQEIIEINLTYTPISVLQIFA